MRQLEFNELKKIKGAGGGVVISPPPQLVVM